MRQTKKQKFSVASTKVDKKRQEGERIRPIEESLPGRLKFHYFEQEKYALPNIKTNKTMVCFSFSTIPGWPKPGKFWRFPRFFNGPCIIFRVSWRSLKQNPLVLKRSAFFRRSLQDFPRILKISKDFPGIFEFLQHFPWIFKISQFFPGIFKTLQDFPWTFKSLKDFPGNFKIFKLFKNFQEPSRCLKTFQ